MNSENLDDAGTRKAGAGSWRGDRQQVMATLTALREEMAALNAAITRLDSAPNADDANAALESDVRAAHGERHAPALAVREWVADNARRAAANCEEFARAAGRRWRRATERTTGDEPNAWLWNPGAGCATAGTADKPDPGHRVDDGVCLRRLQAVYRGY